MSSSSGTKGVFLVMLVAALGVGAVAYYVKATPGAAHVEPELRAPKVATTSRPARDADEATPAKTARQTVFLPEIVNGDVKLASTASDTGSDEPMSFVAKGVVKMTGMDTVRVLGVELRDHVAIVNFSREIKDGMGSMQEGQFLTALQTGFGQFPEVDKVWINVDGQAVDSLGEHIEAVDPIPVLRPGEQTPAKPSEP